MITIKTMKNGAGDWAVFWGTDGKATKLAYKRFFKEKNTAELWAKKFYKKMMKNN